MTVKRSMEPCGANDATLLILGSLPGEASLRAQQYYAHPQNQFWRLLGTAIGEDLQTLPNDRRIDRLAARHIALWDVVAEAKRTGSLDGAIRSPLTNELAAFVASHPRLRAIAFNGKMAAKLGRAALGPETAISFIDLPSSSPAHTMAFADKAEQWAVLGPLAWPQEHATLSP